MSSGGGVTAIIFILLVAFLLRGLLRYGPLEAVDVRVDRARDLAAEWHSLLVLHGLRHGGEVKLRLETAKVAEDAIDRHREQVSARLVDQALEL